METVNPSHFMQRARVVIQFLLIPNFAILFWLVWTPSTSRYCQSVELVPTDIFCLPTLVSGIGNFLLLLPTAFLVFFAWPGAKMRDIALLLVLLPILIELVQNMIPGRDPDIRDVFANSFGGLITAYLLHHRLGSIHR